MKSLPIYMCKPKKSNKTNVMILLFLLLFRHVCYANQGQEFSINWIKYTNTDAHAYALLLKITKT